MKIPDPDWLAFVFVQTLLDSRYPEFHCRKGKVWVLIFERLRVLLEETLHVKAPLHRNIRNNGHVETGSGDKSTTSESMILVNLQP